MGKYDDHDKPCTHQYKPLLNLLFKTLLVFAFSTLGIISVLDGHVKLETTSSKVRTVTRWKRDTAAINGLPYTDYANSSRKTGSPFWESIQPSFECPENLLTKIGDVGDAGRWICGMTTLGNLTKKEGFNSPCSVYSTGSEVNAFFEVEMMALSNCSIYSYEPSAAIVDHPLRYFEDRVHLESVLIAAEDTRSTNTLKTLMYKNGAHQWVDVLKLNVGEGGDIETLENILKDFEEYKRLPIGQLLTRLNVEDWEKSGEMGERIVAVLEGLENKGLRMFHKEISPHYGENIADFSFVNVFGLERFLGEDQLKKYKNF